MDRILLVVLFLAVCGGISRARVPDDEFIRVAPDHWSFETARTHARFVPFGSNLVLASKEDLNLFGPRYTSERYERILAACESLDINLLKVFLPIGQVLPDPQVPGKARIAPGYLANLDDFLTLCRKHHIRVVIALAEWGGNGCKWWHEGGQYFGRTPWKTDPGVDSIDVLKRFWTRLAGRLRDNPTVFAYTPCVEWSFPNSNLTWFAASVQHGVLPSEQGVWYWRHWLLAKYKSIDGINAAWATSYAKLDDVPVVDYSYDEAKRSYVDCERKIHDYQNFREWATLRYFAPQIAAIRAADPNHMVTISNHMRQWDLWPGAARYFMGFTAFEEKGLIDYVTHHANWSENNLKKGSTVDADVIRPTQVMARFCYAGKPMPVMIEEYSFASADRSRTAEVQAAIVEGTIGHASGWTTWYLQYPESPNEADASDKTCSSAWLDGSLKPTPWGERARSLYRELLASDLRRIPPEKTVKLDRSHELVPRAASALWSVILDSVTKGPVDYAVTHEPDLDIKLPGDP